MGCEYDKSLCDLSPWVCQNVFTCHIDKSYSFIIFSFLINAVVLLYLYIHSPSLRHYFLHLNINCTFVYRGGGGGNSDSPISVVPHLKLPSVLILKMTYSIEKCAICLDTSLRL